MTTYTKTPASEKPEEDDTYLTNLGLLHFSSYDGKDEWLNAGCKEEPEYWMKPSNELQKYKEQVDHLNNEIQFLIKKMVPAESLSLEEAFQQWNGGKDSDTSILHGETFTPQALLLFAELYHVTNLAKQREEFERTTRFLQNNKYMCDNYAVEVKNLEQQVKTLRELLSLSREHYIRMTNPLLSRSHNRDHEFIKRVDVALSNTNQS